MKFQTRLIYGRLWMRVKRQFSNNFINSGVACSQLQNWELNQSTKKKDVSGTAEATSRGHYMVTGKKGDK